MTLQALHSVAEVAEALGETEHYVLMRCRRREWPHKRGARNAPKFTDDDFAEILRLMAAESAPRPEPRLSFAPRSRPTGRRASGAA